ncbi:MAG: hypothetical protein IKW89_00995 [Bacteroidales bacterium]|nr:hypothetical protein [Bacteroidales bacterium]
MENKEDRQIARMLLGKNYAWSDLSENKKNLARKVYSICSSKIEKLSELFSQIRQLKFSKRSLADELGTTRKTLGSNNPEVSFLIDKFIEQGKEYWALTSKADEDAPDFLETRKAVIANDCELVEKDNIIRELTKELQARKRQKESIESERDEWRGKYEALAKQIKDGSFPYFKDKNDDIRS